jgi:DNA-binding response OmpR family regulator
VARILAVDDDPDILDLVRIRLTRAGHQLLTATSGPDALAALENRPAPDLAVLDLGMPEMDGFELAERLRDLPGAAHLPLIFLTARAQEEDVARGLSMGARYLTKPFMGGALLHFVDMALQDRAVTADW